MRLVDYFRTAFKNLSRQKARTILTIIAITVGSLSLILMASLIISIKQSLVDQFKSLGAFDLVSVIKDPNSADSGSLIGGANGDPSDGKAIDDATLTAMNKLPYVIEATPIIGNIGVSTMRLEGQNKKTWASFVAYDPDNDVFNLPIAYGRKLTSRDMDKITVGSRFAGEMGFGGRPEDLVGKKILLNFRAGGGSAPDWGELPAKPPVEANKEWYDAQNKAGIEIPVEIIGVTDNGALDDGQSYINIAWARRLMVNVSWQQSGQSNCNGPDCRQSTSAPIYTLEKYDNFVQQGYSSIILKADSTTNINAIADSVKKLGYGANTAQAMLDQINQILLMISAVLAVIGGISLFVATIGIINTMVMATYERTKEIGVLRACGATRATIRRLFMAEAACLGFLGGVFGILISYGLGQIAQLLVSKYGADLGNLPIDNIGSFPFWLVLAVVAFTTVLGTISGLLPAIRAARLNPVEALRYE